MTEQHSSEPIGKEQFLYPQHPYHGKFTPEGLVFNANLQEFGQKIVYLCGLETNGKITSREAYTEIRQLWKQLKASKMNLLADQPPQS
jgi:hypothetical protein